jgi:hypothetical protein
MFEVGPRRSGQACRMLNTVIVIAISRLKPRHRIAETAGPWFMRHSIMVRNIPTRVDGMHNLCILAWHSSIAVHCYPRRHADDTDPSRQQATFALTAPLQAVASQLPCHLDAKDQVVILPTGNDRGCVSTRCRSFTCHGLILGSGQAELWRRALQLSNWWLPLRLTVASRRHQ